MLLAKMGDSEESITGIGVWEFVVLLCTHPVYGADGQL